MNVVSLITVPVKNLWGSQYPYADHILWGARFEIQEIV